MSVESETITMCIVQWSLVRGGADTILARHSLGKHTHSYFISQRRYDRIIHWNQVIVRAFRAILALHRSFGNLCRSYCICHKTANTAEFVSTVEPAVFISVSSLLSLETILHFSRRAQSSCLYFSLFLSSFASHRVMYPIRQYSRSRSQGLCWCSRQK